MLTARHARLLCQAPFCLHRVHSSGDALQLGARAQVRVDSTDSLIYTKYVSALMYAQDLTLTAAPQVFAKRPMPGW